jgi:molecular chaperone GrpE
VDEEPVDIQEEHTKMSTLQMAAVDAEDAPRGNDVISVFTAIVQGEVEALRRAQFAESQPSDSGRDLERFMKQLLTFFDSFERVLEAGRASKQTEEMTNWLKSIEALYFRILKVAENFGLVPLKAIGRVVDLDFHDVVEYRPSLDHPGDTVIAERQKGYLFKGRLLREAQVVVAQSLRS